MKLLAAQDRSQVTLLVFDIDDFKLYNDKYGHGTGDEVLRETARLMLSVVREHDVVARIGGDEFVVVAKDVTAEQMAALAERIRTKDPVELPVQGSFR